MNKKSLLLSFVIFCALHTKPLPSEIRETIIIKGENPKRKLSLNEGEYPFAAVSSDGKEDKIVKIKIPGFEELEIAVDSVAEEELNKYSKSFHRLLPALGIYVTEDLAYFVRESLASEKQNRNREFYNKVAAAMREKLNGSIILIENKEGKLSYRFIEAPKEDLDIVIIPLASNKDQLMLVQIDTDIPDLKNAYKNHFKDLRYHIAGLLAELFKSSDDLKQLPTLSTVGPLYGALNPKGSVFKIINKSIKSEDSYSI